MNCCDEAGNCRQGRDCPVRLARMGMAVPEDNAPSPEQRQRQELRDWLLWALMKLAVTNARPSRSVTQLLVRAAGGCTR